MLEHAEERGEIVDRLSFRVLGPVQVLENEIAIDVGGSKPRLVLVQLLLNPNRVVSTDTLVDALWGEDPPPTARRSLQSHVAKLRAALGGDNGPLKSQAPGYVLVVDEAQIDLCRSEDLARQARASLPSNPRDAHLLAQKAMREWSSEPLGDLATHDQLVPQRRRLDQLWLDLIELDLDAGLALGNTAEVVERLESLVLERPEHEPFWARLMASYYRVGRQSDALLAFRRARTALLETFGIDPSPELQRLEVAILGQTAELETVPAPSCPYKGLASYQLDDAELFYGRDGLVAELVEAVRSAAFVVVVGSSGAGKSSALRAGLVKAVEARKLGGPRQACVITPGPAPLRSIYQVPTSADVVIVDQFEELFTLTDDEATQREFVRLLLARVNTANHVVISLRADFYGYCTRIPELAPQLARRQVVVGPLSEQELRAVITKPAERAGLVVAQDLVDTIVAEAADHAGALPLVSHALVETWQRRTYDALTLDAYREAGSIAAAIARTAERVYDSFQPAQRVQTERLFMRLVEPSEGTEHARRKVPYEQLLGSSIDREVIDVLVEARLLTAGAEGIEMAHEALIEAWPRLRSWIDDNRDGIRMHRHLTSAATSWAELGRDDGELYRGARLSATLSWMGDSAPDLSDLERDFVDGAVAMSDTELRQHVRVNRRLRILVGASVVGLIVAVAGTVLAVSQAQKADRGRAAAEASQLVATVRGQPNLSASARLQLAVAADRRASTPATKGLLLDAIAQDPGFTVGKALHATLKGNTPISANGGVLLGIDDQLIGSVIDASTLEPRPTRPLRPSPTVAVDTGSRLLGVVFGSSLETVDLESGEIAGRLASVTARSSQLGLSPDGTTLAVANDTDESGTQAGVSLYDVSSGRRLLTLSIGDGAAVRDVTFSPDGGHVMAVVDESRPLGWETATGKQLVIESPQTAPITRLAMSPSGTHIALGRDDGLVEMWTLDDREEWQPLDIRSLHHGSISWIDFDQQSERMISTSRDGVAVVWDTTTGKLATRPRTFAERELSVSYFRPGSATSIVSIDTDGRTWEWDLQRDVKLVTTVSNANLGATVSATPETSVLVPSPGGVMAYHPSGGPPHEVPFDSGDTPKRSIAASADGTRFVVAYVDGRLELRDAVSGDLVIDIERHVHSLVFDESSLPPGELMIALNRKGTRVAFLGADQRIEVIDDDGTIVDKISLSLRRQIVQAIDLSDDGSALVISTLAGEAIWYDLEGIAAATIAPGETGFDAQFLSDDRVAIVGTDGAQIIDLRSRQTTTRFNFGTDFTRLAIDSTGRLLATVDGSGGIQLWDARLVARIGDALHIRNVSSSVPIRFSADGHYLLVSGLKETTWVNVWTADWPGVGCSLVTERLSAADLALYLGSSEKVAPCP